MYMIECRYSEGKRRRQIIGEVLYEALRGCDGEPVCGDLSSPSSTATRRFEGIEITQEEMSRALEGIPGSKTLIEIIGKAPKMRVLDVGEPQYPELKGCWSC